MNPIHETEPVAPEIIYPRNVEPPRPEEKPSERPAEDPPVEPDSGKLLDTYA